ncbi:hypothetical protein GWK47_034406 [Chionoecetes opilio]|uniref:Uncharacterized protein n=1 Tax=Chionoecetes opilio TaxID=41210 RepID=A0A8J4YUU7_CHIOP|nr:hypothetical protein GWK47_034406 [Chionoecetes opilio]
MHKSPWMLPVSSRCWTFHSPLDMNRPASPLVSVDEARKGTVLPEKIRNDGEHSPTSNMPCWRNQACSVPGWHLDTVTCPTTDPTAEGCGWTLMSEQSPGSCLALAKPSAAKAVSELVKCAAKVLQVCVG